MLRIVNEAERAKVYIYGRVGKNPLNPGDGVSAQEFSEGLEGLSPKPLDIHIDSGGGDVFEGYAICSAIQRYGGETTAHVDGLAASAASYIAVVCDNVKMSDYAFLMIHKASTIAWGNADDLESLIPRLRQSDETIARIYSQRSKLSMEEALGFMAEEKWFTAEEALAAGLCQEVVETEGRPGPRLDAMLAGRYEHVPDAVRICDAGPSEPGEAADEPPSGPSPVARGEGPSHAGSNLSGNAGGDAVTWQAFDGRLYRKEQQ